MMAKRKPMGLDNIIKCYNFLQVLICSYITIKGYYHSFGQGYSFICEPIDFSTTNYHAVQMTKMAHYYFLTKVVDLLDTVFFVLKKKQTHVTFLHVYHHAGMVLLSFFGTKYFAGGQSVFMGVINSFVHVIMYLYYFLTSIDNKYKHSSWKKYITQLQMVSLRHFHLFISSTFINSTDSIWFDGPSLVNIDNVTRLWLPEMDCVLYVTAKLFHFHSVLRFLPQSL